MDVLTYTPWLYGRMQVIDDHVCSLDDPFLTTTIRRAVDIAFFLLMLALSIYQKILFLRRM